MSCLRRWHRRNFRIRLWVPHFKFLLKGARFLRAAMKEKDWGVLFLGRVLRHD